MSVPLLTVAPVTVRLTCHNPECPDAEWPRFAGGERFTGRIYLQGDADRECPSCGAEMELEES